MCHLTLVFLHKRICSFCPLVLTNLTIQQVIVTIKDASAIRLCYLFAMAAITKVLRIVLYCLLRAQRKPNYNDKKEYMWGTKVVNHTKDTLELFQRSRSRLSKWRGVKIMRCLTKFAQIRCCCSGSLTRVSLSFGFSRLPRGALVVVKT